MALSPTQLKELDIASTRVASGNAGTSDLANIAYAKKTYGYKPTTAIPADTITPEIPLDVTAKPPESAPADGMAAGAAAQTANEKQAADAKAASDAEIAKINAKTAEQTQADALTSRINELLPETQGRAQATATAEANAGVPDLSKQLAANNTAIQTGLAEYNQLKTQYEAARQNVEGQGRNIPLGIVRGQQAQIQYQQQNTLNQKAAEIGLLQAQSLGLQGQITAAQEAAKKAVDLKYSAIEEELAVKQAQLKLLEPTLTRQEAERAKALDRKYEREKIEVADEKAKAKINVAEALSQGIDTRYVNRNGKFYRTMDGKEFNSEAEFFKDAGVTSFKDAYRRGLVTDLSGDDISDRQAVAQMRAEYLDAGISLTDTFDEAVAKLSRSKKYLKETAEKPTDNTGLLNDSGEELNAKQQTLFNQIINKYQSSPLVKAQDRTIVLDKIIDQVTEDPTNGSLQLGLVYSYIQALDTYQSAVREGELSLVNSIDSRIGSLRNSVEKIQNGQIVRPEVIKQIAAASRTLVDTINEGANNKTKDFESQARVNGFKNAWNDYASGLSGSANATDSSALKSAYDKAGYSESYEDIVSEYGEEGVRKILEDNGIDISFSSVGGDTNSASITLGSRLARVNNNPGNLRYVGQAGAKQGEGGFAKFPTPEAGVRALEAQIKLDARRGHTLASFIKKFAPPSENDTGLYVKQLASRLGVSPTTKISDIDVRSLAREVAKKESSSNIG